MGTAPTPPPDLVTEDESPGQRTVEVAIPNVGTFVIESEEGGYDDETMMTPNMQGIIMAIGKSGSVYEKNGPEAAFFKVQPLSFTFHHSTLTRLLHPIHLFFHVYEFLSFLSCRSAVTGVKAFN